MRVVKLSAHTPWDKKFNTLDVDHAGSKILAQKTAIESFLITHIKTPAANILKQEALSAGGDVATPRSVIVCGEEVVDVVLFATQRQLHTVCRKLLAQPFGLKEIAKEIESFLHTKAFPLQIMGVLNVNDDSFFGQSRVNASSVISRVYEMIDHGAHIIDIGAVSSRPGSSYPGVEVELQRLNPLLDALYCENIHEKVILSIDAFEPKVVAAALEKGFKIVNDITGLRNDDVVKLAVEYHAQAVMMHMQGSPETMQKDPTYENVILDIDDYFQNQLDHLDRLGLTNVVLDVGIGFGKSVAHNIALIKHMGHFSHFHLPLLVGASRKSMINTLSPSDVDQRLAGTLVLHTHAVQEGASIIRCHDVFEHRQALAVMSALREAL